MPDKNLKFSILSHFFIALVLDGLQRLSGLFMLEILQSGVAGRQNAALPFTLSWAVANIVASFSEALFWKKKSDHIVLLGVLLTAIGAALCLLTTNITAQILCWGLIFGSGYGLLSPHISKQLRSMNCTKLSSFLQATPSLGAAIMPFIFHMLTSHYGLQGSYLIFSGIILNYFPLFVAAAYNIKVIIPNIKWRVRKRSNHYFVSKQEKSQVVSNESFINSFEPDMILNISEGEECQDDLVIERDISDVSAKEEIYIGRKRSETRCNDLQSFPIDKRILPSHRTQSDMAEEIEDYEKRKKLLEGSFSGINVMHEDVKSIRLGNIDDRNCNVNVADKILENNILSEKSRETTEVMDDLNSKIEISQNYTVCPMIEIEEKMKFVNECSEEKIGDCNVAFHTCNIQENLHVQTRTFQEQVQVQTSTVQEQVQIQPSAMQVKTSAIHYEMQMQTRIAQEQLQFQRNTLQEQNDESVCIMVEGKEDQTTSMQGQVQVQSNEAQEQMQIETSTVLNQVQIQTKEAQEQMQSKIRAVQNQVQIQTNTVQQNIPFQINMLQEQKEVQIRTVQEQVECQTSAMQEQAEVKTTAMQEQVEVKTSTVQEHIQDQNFTVQQQKEYQSSKVQEQAAIGTSIQKPVEIQTNTVKDQVQIQTGTMQDETFQNTDKSFGESLKEGEIKDLGGINYKDISLTKEDADEKGDNSLKKVDQFIPNKTAINNPLTIKVHVEEFIFINEEEYLSETLNDKYIKPRKNSYRKHSNSMMPGTYDNIDFTTLNCNKKFEKCSKIGKPKLSCIHSISEHTNLDERSSFSLKVFGKDKNGDHYAISKIKPIFKFVDDITKPVCLCIILIKIIFEFNLVTLITIFADFGKDVDSECSDFKWILVAFGVGGLLGKFCCCKISRTIPEKSHAIGVVLFLLTALCTAGVLFSPNLNWLAGFYCILGALEGGITCTIPKFVVEHIDRDVHQKLSSAKSFLSGMVLISVPYAIGLSRDELGDYEFLLQTLSCSSVLCAFLAYFLPHLSRASDQRINYNI